MQGAGFRVFVSFGHLKSAPEQVGVTAMLIASKYEEIWAPEVHDFVYISDSAYKREQILQMEKLMLNSLKFNLTGEHIVVQLCTAKPDDKRYPTMITSCRKNESHCRSNIRKNLCMWICLNLIQSVNNCCVHRQFPLT